MPLIFGSEWQAPQLESSREGARQKLAWGTAKSAAHTRHQKNKVRLGELTEEDL